MKAKLMAAEQREQDALAKLKALCGAKKLKETWPGTSEKAKKSRLPQGRKS